MGCLVYGYNKIDIDKGMGDGAIGPFFLTRPAMVE